ncbi:hypothetical protein [Flavicella marina]|uniref:hypothetical protein n=1 Tax=Flavicella marina TaxID=1475951 RepID=UPI0012657E54|nr:hypothetical protein [Flavicella marina]
MRNIITILIFSVSLTISSQTNYHEGMQQAFGLWGQQKNTEAVHMFERIANAEQTNWVPYYYAAQVEVTSSFGEKDVTVLDANLKKGQLYLDKAMTISKDNPELLVLQALLYTAWVAYDGATYGRKYSKKINKLYEKAEKIAPENPRAAYCHAEWNIGAAKFFGNDIQPFVKDLEKSLDLFATFELPSPFYPNWGEERAKVLLESYKS